jgi:beta-lactamase class A
MRPTLLGLLLALLSAAASAQPATEPDDWSVVHDQVDTLLRGVAQETPGVVGYVVEVIETGERFEHNADLVFPQGSTIKVPILVALHEHLADGRVDPAARIAVDRSDQVGGSGVLGLLGDGTSALAPADLGVLMIAMSDNTATNLLIDLLGYDAVNASTSRAGLTRTRLARAMMDEAARAQGHDNVSTPAEAVAYLRALHAGELLSPDATAEVLRVLRLPKPTDTLRGLPPGTRAAWKPGSIPGVRAVWALVEVGDLTVAVAAMGKLGEDASLARAVEEIVEVASLHAARRASATRYGTYVDPSMLPR